MNFGLETQSGFSSDITLNIDIWMSIIFWVAFIFLAIFLIRKIIRIILFNTSYFDHVIFLIKLPKNRGNREANNAEESIQHLKEDIAVGETIFNAIGGLRAQRGFKAWFLGRTDHFSFEIVACNGEIYFYMAAPKNYSRYLEQQIHAHYPDAVIDKVEDYNIFKPKTEILAGYLKTRREFLFPIKTYQKMDTDPLNSLVNVMSKIDKEEGIAVQYVVRSAKAIWHKRILEVVRAVNSGKSISEAIGSNTIKKILGWLGEIVELAKPTEKNSMQEPNNKNDLSPMEQEMLKVMEEKNSKAGLDVNMRIVISAKNRGQAQIYYNNITNAFSQYNLPEYGNSFKPKMVSKTKSFFSGERNIVKNFIFRRFSEKISFLLNTEELASVYHLPLPTTETPNIAWLSAKSFAAPENIPTEGIILGKNVYRGVSKDIRIKRDDRRRHTYILGKSGGGKSVLIANMAIQDILNGEGVGVLDPHGDLIKDILERIPPERAEDVILFRPADFERPIGLNLIEFDPRYPEQKTFVINEMINIFDKLYNLKETGGPIFEQYMRNALLLIMSDPESGSTLMEVPKVLADPDFRAMKLSKCSDPTVVDFWRKEAEKAGGEAALANVVPYVTSKLTQFISNDTMRPIIGQQKSSFNLRDIMDKQKILLVDLSKGAIGEMNAYLLGMILVGKILMSALSRTDLEEEKRKDFYLYIDEFQNFTTDSICSILSEARKYRLNLIIANQYLGQLVTNQDSSIKEAVFGNVGTWIVFKVGSEDAEVLEKEFTPVFTKNDLINIEKYTTYIKLLIDNTASKPFSMATPWPLPGQKDSETASKIISLSRLKYGQDRNVIEAQINLRAK